MYECIGNIYLSVRAYTCIHKGTSCLCTLFLCVLGVDVRTHVLAIYTAIPIIFEGQFQVFQRFSSSKLVLKAVESCFVALNYCGNGNICTFVQFRPHR